MRSELSHTGLPRQYVMVDGEVMGQIQPRYQRIWTRSVNWCLRFLDQCHDLPVTKFLTVKEAFEGAVDCLALNYRVTAEELSSGFPGLLTDESLTSILDAAIDWDFFKGASGDQKKSESLAQCSAIMQQLLQPSEE